MSTGLPGVPPALGDQQYDIQQNARDVLDAHRRYGSYSVMGSFHLSPAAGIPVRLRENNYIDVCGGRHAALSGVPQQVGDVHAAIELGEKHEAHRRPWE